VRGPAVSGRLWDQATDSTSQTATAGADNASGTHHPGQPIRPFGHALDDAAGDLLGRALFEVQQRARLRTWPKVLTGT